MAGDSAETSNKSNKSFYSTVFVLFFISKLYLKKFKQFSLGDLLKIKIFNIFVFLIPLLNLKKFFEERNQSKFQIKKLI